MTMSTIHLKRNTLNALIDKILFCDKSDSICEIVLVKKYNAIRKILDDLELFDFTVKKCVMSYVNDIITLAVGTKWKYGKNIVDIYMYIMSKTVILNFKKCVFAFNLSMKITNDFYKYRLYYRPDYIKEQPHATHLLFTMRSNDKNKTAYDARRHTNLITLFNTFMNAKYHKKSYIWNTVNFTRRKYSYIPAKSKEEQNILQYNNYSFAICDVNMLKNVIVILKLVIDKFQLYFDAIPPENMYNKYAHV